MMIMNKKIIFLTIIVSFFAFTNIVFGENVTVSCTDSDGGNNFTLKGTTIGFPNEYVTKISSNLQTVQDFCINDQLVQEYSCMSANASSQFYGVLSSTSSECSSCNDGACVNIKEITSCEGSTNSNIEAYSYGAQIKVSYNYGAQQIFTDGCGISSGSGEIGIQHYFCGFTSGSKPHFWSVLKSCSNGCSNGACLNQTTKPDLKVDKISYYLDDSTNPKKLYYQVTVKNIGTASANFETNIQVPQLSNYGSSTCSYLNPGELCIATGYGYDGLGGTISNGYYDIKAYVDPRSLVDELNEGNNQLEIKAFVNSSGNASCSDSDGGINYFLKGCTSICSFTEYGGGCGIACDSCSGNILTEGYCEGNQGKTIKYTCPSDYICSNGACVKSTNNAYTVTIQASDSSDSYLRDWNIFTYDPTGTYIGNGKWSSGTPLKTSYYTRSGTWSVNLNSGTYYLVIGQTGGESYGTYSGEISINGVSMHFTNADINHAIKFNVPLQGNTSNKCVNHDECSQACDNLDITSKWMGSVYNRKSWEGTCPTGVYGCMTGKCCLGQCNQDGICFCQRTNIVDIYGDVCPQGTACGDDCECHPVKEEFKFYIKTDKYSYTPGENVRITAILSGDSSINFNEAKVITYVSDNQGTQTEIKMEQVGASASTCIRSAIGTYTCSIKTEYQFVGNHIIPSDGPVGTWKILSTGVAGGNKKNAEINFEVQKVAYDYVDVSINPKEQSTIIGKEVKYDVTITDKHPVMKCYTATPIAVTSGGVSIATGAILASAETTVSATTPVEAKTEIVKCGPQIYNYLVDVGGLPYHTVFPNVISVHAGGSNTFELKVFPSSVKTAEGITTTVETTTTAATAVAERSVTITGQPIATQPSVTSTQQETTPVKEATFKFAVKAYLKEDQTTSDSAIGVLHVKFIETPEPPPFPDTEKINIELNKGWNLVSVPGKGIGFIKGTCSEDKKPVAFMYVPDKQRYVSFEETVNSMGNEKLLDYLSTHSFWVYSYDDCNIGFKFNGYSTYSGLAITRGWNLLGVTKDMIGETLNNIKGSCNFEKIYKWDSDAQKWIEKSGDDLIQEKGNGIIVQTVTDCNLKTNSIQPPPFPGE